jgi:hypothetical protein
MILKTSISKTIRHITNGNCKIFPVKTEFHNADLKKYSEKLTVLSGL